MIIHQTHSTSETSRPRRTGGAVAFQSHASALKQQTSPAFSCLYLCIDSSGVHSFPRPTFFEQTSSGQHESMHFRLPDLWDGHLRPRPACFLVESVSRL